MAEGDRLDGHDRHQLRSCFQWTGGHLEQGEFPIQGVWNKVSSLFQGELPAEGVWNRMSSLLRVSGTW